jgi:hypothetical protein
MMLAFTELTALRAGIVPRPQGGGAAPPSEGGGDEGALLWSGISDGGVVSTCTQVLGDHTYTLSSNATTFTGEMDGVTLFTASAGVRVVTDLTGTVIAVVGIDTVTHTVSLTLPPAVVVVVGAAAAVAVAVVVVVVVVVVVRFVDVSSGDCSFTPQLQPHG